ncbi:MAG: hypothetical protein QOH06_959, partial [Acidobacteriota bacterium]|nr:hypothetical protein [Acidobacteriota bacterium]
NIPSPEGTQALAPGASPGAPSPAAGLAPLAMPTPFQGSEGFGGYAYLG